MSDLSVADVFDGPADLASDRGRAAGRPWPARDDLRAARRGRPRCGRTGSRSPSCRTAATVRAPGRSGPSPSCSADVHAYANVFHTLGVRRGDAVALLAPNCDELVTATLAAQLAGIAAPLNGGLSPEHIAELLRRSGARVLVAAGPELAPAVWDDRTSARRRRSAGRAARPAAHRGGRRSDRRCPRSTGCASATSRDWRPEHDPPTPSSGTPPGTADLAALFHTGGTTGTPKLAAHTHANEVTDAWMIAANSTAADAGRGGVRRAAAVPRQRAGRHPAGPAVQRGTHVVWAGPLGYRDPALFAQFWKLVEHYRVTAMSAVPTVYAVLAGCPGRRRHQQPALRHRRRLPAAARGPGRLRVRHRHRPGRGLRPDRGHLRQRAAASPTTRGPAPSASACPTSG